ncbi:MAG: lysophospholipid acyltransferase family protein [Ignavibacteriales bacterium]|nr:lysophospholipid acyltransferase family protein [Ignavibacteriales bacterium]
MIQKAKHHWFLYPFFRFYAKRLIKKHFYRVILKSDFNEKNLPVMLIGNHFSWWDGFFVSYLNDKVFKKKIYIMMDEEQLSKYKFFNKTGCYSVRKGSRSIIETIEYTKELLKSNSNLVVIFPQGEIESLYKEELKFEKGLEKIMKDLDNEFQILFMVNLVEYFSQKRPYLFTYLQEYQLKDTTIDKIQTDFNVFLRNCKVENIILNDKL